MASQNLDIIVRLQDQASKELGKLDSKFKSMESGFKKMAFAGTAVFAGVTAVIAKSTQAFAKSESQLARVDQSIRNIDLKAMNTDFATASRRAREFGSSLQRLAGISDEEGAESFAKLLQITNDYTEAQKLATLSADLATAKQVSLDSATKMVSMAMAGNTRVLREYGIVLDDGATKQEVIEELKKRVGGQAEAYGKTFAGQSAILKQTFGDMQESIGKSFAPILQQVMDKLIPIVQKIMDFAEANPVLTRNILLTVLALSGLVAVVGVLGLLILSIPKIVLAWGASMATLGISTGTLIGILAQFTLIIGGIAFGIKLFINHWDSLKDTIADSVVFQKVVDFLLYMWTDVLKPIFGELWQTIQQLIENPMVKEFFKQLAIIIGVLLVGGILALVVSITGLIALFGQLLTRGIKLATVFTEVIYKAWKGLGEGIVYIFGNVFNVVKSIFDGIINIIIKGINFVINAVNKVLNVLSKIPGAKSIGVSKLSTVDEFKGQDFDATKFLKSFEQVNDAIISPNGNVITTHPDDYLIATKNPSSLAGGGEYHIHLNLDGREVTDVIFNNLMGELRQNVKLS